MCQAYDGRMLEAYALVVATPELIGSFHSPPSRRYLDLIIGGAKAYKLDADYVRGLELLPSTTPAKWQFAYVLAGFVALLPVTLLMLAYQFTSAHNRAAKGPTIFRTVRPIANFIGAPFVPQSQRLTNCVAFSIPAKL